MPPSFPFSLSFSLSIYIYTFLSPSPPFCLPISFCIHHFLSLSLSLSLSLPCLHLFTFFSLSLSLSFSSPVGWDCRIHQLQRCKTPTSKKYPKYDTKISDDEASVLELSGIESTLSLPLLPGLLWPRVVVSVRVPTRSRIDLFKHLTVCKWIISIRIINIE